MIRLSLELIPQPTLGKYHETKHIWRFPNGSTLEFGYCENEKSVYMYQSAEYDAIGFDEATHFTSFQIIYMSSRVRGINSYPKSCDYSTNPGNVGHVYFKETFIDGHAPFEIWEGDDGLTYQFIPAKVKNNPFLMKSDPDYVKRLLKLPEADRKRLMDGDWDIFEGMYFPEFNRDIHVIDPFDIPIWWKKFRCMDYGLDCCAVLWIAVDDRGDLIVYRELHKPNLNLTAAAKEILRLTPPGEQVDYTVASPDLWNRDRTKNSKNPETGVPEMETMVTAGLKGLIKADNRRVAGWRHLREYLTVVERIGQDGESYPTAPLHFFKTCTHIISDLPSLQHDETNGEDAADNPHDITHSCECLRYGCMSRPPISITDEEKTRRKKIKEKLSKPRSSVTGY